MAFLPTGEEVDAELHWYVMDAHGPLCDRRVIRHVGSIEGAQMAFAKRYHRQGHAFILVAAYRSGAERWFSFLTEGESLGA